MTTRHSLNDRGLRLLDETLRGGRQAITTAEVAKRLGLSPQSATNLCTRLQNRGLLSRVSRGRYVVRQLGFLGTPAAAESIPLAVGSVFGSEPHRIAYRSALAYHDLTQHPAATIQVALVRQIRTTSLSGRPFQPTCEKADTVSVGSQPAGSGAFVSDLERSLVDAGRRPDLVGGLDVVAEAIRQAAPSVNWERLSEYLGMPGFRAAGRRLASVASRIGVPWRVAAHHPASAIRAYPTSAAKPVWRDAANAVIWSSTDVDSVPLGAES